MKNLIISILLYSISFLAQANTVGDLKYRDQSLKNTNKFINIANALTTKLSEELYTLDFKPLSKQALPEIYFAHQSYSNKKSTFMFRLGLKYPKKLEGKIIKYKEGYLYHFKDKVSSALFSSGMSKLKFRALIGKYKKALTRVDISTVYSFKISPISRAFASSESCNGNSGIVPIIDVKDYDNVNEHVSTNSMASMAGDCFMSAVKAAWASTGGLVQDVGSGIWNFIKNPVKSIGKAWDGAVNMVKTTTNFISNIKENIKAAGAALAGLSSEMISKIMCSIVGGLGAGQLLKLLINPALGIATLIPKVAKFFNKIGNSAKILNTLQRVSQSYEDSSKIINTFLSNLLLSSSASFDKTLSLLSKYNMDDRLLEYGVCGLD